MAKVLINETSLSGIADAIRAKNGSSETYKPSEMAAAIEAIEAGGGGGGLPEEALVLTGDCHWRFVNGGWDWFVNDYGSQVTTKDISNASYMFQDSQLKNIPFEFNFKSANVSYFLANSRIETAPIMNGSVSNVLCLFQNNYLKTIPAETWSSLTINTGSSASGIFQNCYSLRQVPIDFFKKLKLYTSSLYAYTYAAFSNCYAVDEIVNLPLTDEGAVTSNSFYSTFNYCSRLNNFTFATPDGAPYVMQWKNQTIDLSSYTGYARSYSNIVTYNSGITRNKEVKDDATYQALKNDPDWYTCNVAYSRYNHDSAVATINSLPDTSAYLATAGGTNTIKFKGACGSATDGGAINTLTDAEIAVAAAKGWTVTIS